METNFKKFHEWRVGKWPAQDDVPLRAVVVMVMESAAAFLDQWALTAARRGAATRLHFDAVDAHTLDHERRLTQLEKSVAKKAWVPEHPESNKSPLYSDWFVDNEHVIQDERRLTKRRKQKPDISNGPPREFWCYGEPFGARWAIDKRMGDRRD